MRVDGREIGVSGSLLQPMPRRTNDILRLVVATVLLALIITSSLITRPRWVALEKSISEIVGVLSPTQSNLVYLIYGIAILALPFVILIALIIRRQWKLLGAYAAAGALAILPFSISGNGIAAPRWHFDLSDRLNTVLAQFLDDPRWIAMLAAVLTVSGPWLPARWRHWWWTLLLAFVPIHLVVSAVVPDRAVLGLAVGWVVGSLVVLVVGTPALEVPLEDAVRAMARRGFLVSGLRVVRPAGRGPLVLSAACAESEAAAVAELYGPHQRSGGTLRQLWRKLRLRGSETAPLQTSMRRAVEHRALMAIAVGDLGVANTSPIAVAELERGWTLYAHKAIRGVPIADCAQNDAGYPYLGSARGAARLPDFARRPQRQRNHRRRRHSAFRWVRQRRIRRHRPATPIRPRPAPGDDVSALRRGVRGERSDRRVRQRRGAERVAPTHQGSRAGQNS